MITELHGHRYDIGSDEVQRQDVFLQRWRYVCSCGSRGNWTFKSAEVAHLSWTRHVARAQGKS